MSKMVSIFLLLVIGALSTACSSATPSLPNTASTPLATTISLIQTATAGVPMATETAQTAPSATAASTSPIPTATPTLTATNAHEPTDLADLMLGDYRDDRSTPSGLVMSLFNAINRKEYLRAYSYWENPANNPQVGTFDQYQQGYQDTNSVQVSLGTITGGAGAGQRYYSVPAVLQVQTTGGQKKTYAGCYVLHLASPEIQAAPPFQPLSIQSAQVQPEENNSDPNSLLAGACPTASGETIVNLPIDPNTIAATNYLDDRSTPQEVLRSLFNAINRKEYARAFSYWQIPIQTFDQFQQGYANTTSVDLTFGTPTSDVGAGQIRFRQPVVLKAQTTSGQTQFFAGCYQMHLGQPTFQATPPFQPLGIEKALVNPAANKAEATQMMESICSQMN